MVPLFVFFDLLEDVDDELLMDDESEALSSVGTLVSTGSMFMGTGKLDRGIARLDGGGIGGLGSANVCVLSSV